MSNFRLPSVACLSPCASVAHGKGSSQARSLTLTNIDPLSIASGLLVLDAMDLAMTQVVLAMAQSSGMLNLKCILEGSSLT